MLLFFLSQLHHFSQLSGLGRSRLWNSMKKTHFNVFLSKQRFLNVSEHFIWGWSKGVFSIFDSLWFQRSEHNDHDLTTTTTTTTTTQMPDLDSEADET